MFLIVASAFGLACAVVTPPLQGPDEPAHWFRADEISRGRWVDVRRNADGRYAYGGWVPASLPACCDRFSGLRAPTFKRARTAIIFDEFRRPLRPEVVCYVAFPSAALYSPLPYAPAAALMWVGRSLHGSPIALLYLGRLGTLASYITLGWAAVRATPILKWPAVLLLCSPMGLFLAGSVSADPVTIGFAFLTTALVLRAVVRPAPLSSVEIVKLAAAVLGVAACKVPYLPLVGLVAAIPRSRWPKRGWAAPVALMAAGAAVAIGWSALSHPQHARQRGDDPARQLAWVAVHPTGFAVAFARTAWHRWPDYVSSSVGDLGWLDALMPAKFVFAFFVTVAYLTFFSVEPTRLGPWPRVVAGGAWAASVGLVGLGTYMVWDRVGAREIEGVQGRYFLPVALLACAVVRRGSRRTVRPTWMLVLLTSIGGYTIWTLVARYYLPA